MTAHTVPNQLAFQAKVFSFLKGAINIYHCHAFLFLNNDQFTRLIIVKITLKLSI